MARSSMEGIFRVRALRKATGPEELDRLAPLAPPRAWVILAVAVAMTGAALGWGVLGKVPVTVRAEGVVSRGGSEAILFVPFLEGKRVASGMPVRLTDADTTARVVEISELPATRAEIERLLGNQPLADWFAARGPSLYIRTRLAGRPLATGTPLQAKVVVSERRPITLLWSAR